VGDGAMIDVIKISKPNCRPCAVLANYLGEIDFAAQDATLTEIDLAEQPAVIDEYRLTSVPVLVFKRNGVEVTRLNGLHSVEEIVETIELAKVVR
jgi:thioredoxin 1